MKKTKFYYGEQIEEKFDKLSAIKKVAVLEVALSNMQFANWKSRIMCIAEAMGYENKLGGNADYVKIKYL